MARMTTRALILLPLLAAPAWAQDRPASPTRLVGRQLGRQMSFDTASGTTRDVVTLGFEDAGTASSFTIDVIARYSGRRPLEPPAVVDLVVTHHPADEDRPDAAIRVDGSDIPAMLRLNGRRSIVASLPFEQFIALAGGSEVVERAFGVELVLGPAQLETLRATAERWSAR